MNTSSLATMVRTNLEIAARNIAGGVTDQNYGTIARSLVEADTTISTIADRLMGGSVLRYEALRAQGDIGNAVEFLRPDGTSNSSAIEHIREAIRHVQFLR